MEPVRAKAKFAWVSTTRPAAAALGFRSGRGAGDDSKGGAPRPLARFLAAARGVVLRLPPPPPRSRSGVRHFTGRTVRA